MGIIGHYELTVYDKKGLDVLLAWITSEVFHRKGSGFTWEIDPEIIVTHTFRAHQKWFPKKGEEPFSWKLHHSDHGRSTNLTYVNQKVDKHISIIEEKALPKGVFVEKTLPLILIDQTTLRPPKDDFDHAKRIEGRKVYLTVTDEYAARIFREVYTDSGLPFRDLLLAKHHQILKKIALSFNLLLSHRKESLKLRVRFEGVCVGPKYFEFKDFGMQPLDTHGQLYGMLLAIIETLNSEYPEWSTPVFNQYYMSDYDGVALSVIPKAEIPPELQQW